jgi:hypothetical protein
MTTFYCLRFETPPTWKVRSPGPPRNRVVRLYPEALCSLLFTSYDSQGYGGSIQPRLHTGNESPLIHRLLYLLTTMHSKFRVSRYSIFGLLQETGNQRNTERNITLLYRELNLHRKHGRYTYMLDFRFLQRKLRR